MVAGRTSSAAVVASDRNARRLANGIHLLEHGHFHRVDDLHTGRAQHVDATARRDFGVLVHRRGARLKRRRGGYDANASFLQIDQRGGARCGAIGPRAGMRKRGGVQQSQLLQQSGRAPINRVVVGFAHQTYAEVLDVLGKVG